jgi:cytochrome oxidase Cu insertion factor (SCO1/SenC/PrrC family)
MDTQVRSTRSCLALFVAAAAILNATGCQKAPERAIDRPLGTKPEQPAPLPVAGRVEPDEEGGSVAITDLPFTLTDQQGKSFDSKSLAGKVWMGAIFFANCPGPCFRENQAIADILRKIDDPDFMVVSLTCDPDNDTPDVLRRYADRFEADPARWKFLTGDMAVIKRVAGIHLKMPHLAGVKIERGQQEIILINFGINYQHEG